MIKSRAVATALAIAATLMLAGCFADTKLPSEQDPATTIKTISELQGTDVQLAPGETLGVDTEGADAVLYDAMILDGSIASYEPSKDGSQIRITAIAEGKSDVLLGDPDGSVDDISFTLTVAE